MSTRALQFELLLNGILHPTTGAPLAAGTVDFYAAGTTTAKNVWTSKAKAGAATSVTLGADGTKQIYGDGEYKLVVKDSAGATHYTWDNVRCQYPNFSVVTKTANYTATIDDDVILVNTSGGARTITLPAAATVGHAIIIKNIGANNCVIDGDGSETIDGSATYTITTQNETVTLMSDGSNWYVSVTLTKSLIDGMGYAADAEASDTYVITLSPAPAALYAGMIVSFKANTANTGAATLNVNALGAKNILKKNDQALVTGDIEASQIVVVIYDGTSWQMVSQLAGGINVATDIGAALSVLGTNSAGTALEWTTNVTRIKTGTYTGDGSTSKAITGVGFQPKFVMIWDHTSIVTPAASNCYMKLDQSWGDIAYRMHDATAAANQINSLDADGFTVDDAGTDADPNRNGRVYDYLLLG